VTLRISADLPVLSNFLSSASGTITAKMKFVRFTDRFHAGRLLADKLKEILPSLKSPIVIGLPRGGIEVAYEIAKAINAPLDVIIVRKIGAPGNPEYAIGALAETGELLLSQEGTAYKDFIEKARQREQEKIEHYKRIFRHDRKISELHDRSVIITDDGVATGFTFKSAVKAIRALTPFEVIAAIPVAPLDVAEEIEEMVDRLIILEKPVSFFAVSQFYAVFFEHEDEFYRNLLAQ